MEGTPMNSDMELMKMQIQALQAQLDQKNSINQEQALKEKVMKVVTSTSAEESAEAFLEILNNMNKPVVKEPEMNFPEDIAKEAQEQLNLIKLDPKFKDLDNKILSNFAADKAKIIIEARKQTMPDLGLSQGTNYRPTASKGTDPLEASVSDEYRKMFPGYGEDFYKRVTNEYLVKHNKGEFNG